MNRHPSTAGVIAVSLLLAAPATTQDTLPTIAEKTKDFEVIRADGGGFVLRKKGRKLFLEVPGGKLDQPFLLASAYVGGNSLASHHGPDVLVQWERMGKKLLLVEKDTKYRAGSDDPVQAVVRRTYTDRIITDVDIVAEEGGSVLIDAMALFAGNASLFAGSIGGGLRSSLAKIDKVKAFPMNAEIALTMPRSSDGRLVTLHYSLLFLPTNGYKPRQADDRIGYFLTAVKDFTKRKGEDRFLRFVNRWHLEKVDPSLRLSPPKNPIVFYIEKTVPIKWRRFVRDAILEWNKAFEKIGYTGAIVVRQQTGDNEFKDLDPEDARYNFFRWITSESPFAMADMRIDPRTGQVIDGDVIMDDSMVRGFIQDYEQKMKDAPAKLLGPRVGAILAKHPDRHPLKRLRQSRLLREELQRQRDSSRTPAIERATRVTCSMGEGKLHQVAMGRLAATLLFLDEDPKKKERWLEEFIGSVIKETVMHELGHILGLRHNFVASTMLTLDEINSDKGPKVTVGSVMDYNGVNLATKAEKQGAYITNTIGPYDYLAIEYGYKTVEKAEDLAKIAARAANKGLHYATDEDIWWGADPFVNTYDLGADPLAFAKQRLELVDELLPQLEARVVRDGDSYAKLRNAVNMLLWEKLDAAMVAAKFLGGERYHRDHKGDENGRKPIEIISAARQREALKLICDHLLGEDAFQLDPELLSRLGANRWDHWGMFAGSPTYSVQDDVTFNQSVILLSVLDGDALSRIADQSLKVTTDPFTLGELMQKLTRAIFAELDSEKPELAPVRRNLQRRYVDQLIDYTINGVWWGPEGLRAIAHDQLTQLHKQLGAVDLAALDIESRAHLRENKVRIGKALDAAYQAR